METKVAEPEPQFPTIGSHPQGAAPAINPFEEMGQPLRPGGQPLLKLDPGLTKVLREPIKEMKVAIPVRMDDGRTRSSSATACSTTSRAARQRAASAIDPTSRSTRCARWRPG